VEKTKVIGDLKAGSNVKENQKDVKKELKAAVKDSNKMESTKKG